MKSHGLEKELNEVKASLPKESDEHDYLRIIVQLVFDDLKLAQSRRRARTRFAPSELRIERVRS